MPCCSAINCSNRTEKGHRLFPLPQGERNEKRRNKWLKNIGRKTFPSTIFVCQKHFTDDQFENNRKDGKKLLRWDAVPTIFDHLPPPKPKRPPPKPRGPPPKSRKRPLQRICLDVTLSNGNKGIETMPVDENENVQAIEDVEDKEKTELKRKLKAAYKKINLLEKQLHEYKKNFENLFNSDQIVFLLNQSLQGFTWSDETINNALKLYTYCGRIGYEEIRKQNLPYPCIRTLQQRIANFKSTPDIKVGSTTQAGTSFPPV